MEWTGALDAKIHGFLLKPRNFDATKRYPLLVLIHGGPQGAWNDAWSYRWNPQIFTDAGYVVFMPNPRGSTTYGQQFTNEISGDWGGKVFIDLKNGIAEVSASQPVHRSKSHRRRRCDRTAVTWSIGFSVTTTIRAFVSRPSSRTPVFTT